MLEIGCEQGDLNPTFPITKIVSGGQTGVDQAALDVALALNLPCSGWCPKGRKSEVGVIPLRYPLVETPTSHYEQRTEWNVRDSDGTLILCRGTPNGGTAFTMDVANRLNKPMLVVDLVKNPDPRVVLEWIRGNQVQILNVAGPRESREPGVREEAALFLLKLLVVESPIQC